jgi:hypothetical protein
MKKLLLLASFGAFYLGANAQQNLNLEQWTAGPGATPHENADGWFSFNDFLALGAPIPVTVEKVSANPGGGSFSAKVMTLDCPSCPLIDASLTDTLPGILSQEFAATGSRRPATFSFKYKYDKVGGDEGVIFLQGWNYVNNQRVYVAQAVFPATANVGTWTTQTLNVLYLNNNQVQVDSLEIAVVASADAAFNGAPPAEKGSAIYVDDFAITYHTNVSNNDVASNSGINVFPNPAKNILNFNFTNVDARTIDIYDMSGKLVNSTEVRNNTITVNVSEMSNGLYIYQIRDNDGNTIKSSKFNVVH